jgi:hypothetical protein
MSEAKENPKPSKRSKRKAPMEPLGWDEIVSQPGMGGYLSFLNGPVPLPHLQQAGSGTAIAPEVVSMSEIEPDTACEAVPGSEANPEALTTPVVNTDPGVYSNRAVDPTTQLESIPVALPDPQVIAGIAGKTSPAVGPAPEIVRDRVVDTSPGVVSIPRQNHVRKCFAARDGHSLGEEVLYQALWSAAAPESDVSRTIVIGWRGMSQLCRMTPKNCKINTQRLIRKLALEVLSPYNTPESIGTTYRVYSSDDILRRRRQAGLEWVVRSRGVEFVNPGRGA